MCIFGIAIGVPTLKGLCNLSCSGSCSFDGFDLACNCQVPVVGINVEDGGESSGDFNISDYSVY